MPVPTHRFHQISLRHSSRTSSRVLKSWLVTAPSQILCRWCHQSNSYILMSDSEIPSSNVACFIDWAKRRWHLWAFAQVSIITPALWSFFPIVNCPGSGISWSRSGLLGCISYVASLHIWSRSLPSLKVAISAPSVRIDGNRVTVLKPFSVTVIYIQW